MANRKSKDKRKFMADFETTVYEGQEHTEVWAAALVEIGGPEEVTIDHSIEDFFDRLREIDESIVVYFHNLKFDGEFILSYLVNEGGYHQALLLADDGRPTDYKDRKDLRDHEFITMISDRGAWYTITVKIGHKTIEFRDSLKLLPFSVKEIGKAFKTKHQKLEMEYDGFRYAGCEITEEEQKYIANDVLVVKEALEIMFSEGHDRLTIGSCCLEEFKGITGKWDYEYMFPQLEEIPLDGEVFEQTDADAWIRKSYRGGWCYLAKGKENKLFGSGTTADVNSLYPSMMHSQSGNRYPVGFPTFWSGNYIPDEALGDDKYYFVRIKTRFYLKPGKLPFIQIKGSVIYPPTKCLESSDYISRRTGERKTTYTTRDGIHDTRCVLTMTKTDYILFCDHYYVAEFEILGGCWFNTRIGIFDDYIDKYKQIKMTSTGAKRTLAKLFLNNLYGKLATGRDSSFKYAYTTDDQVVHYLAVQQLEKRPGFIAIGSAITSYARNFTIRAAQANYHGPDQPGFIYADTDSIHCDLPPEEIKGIRVDPADFCCWKLETCWDQAIFVRQKTYIEHVTHEDLKPVEKPYHNIKCAGMPTPCKEFLNASFDGVIPKGDWKENELRFMEEKREYTDFKRGLLVPGKLVPRRMPGGIVLTDTTYEIRS